MRDLVSELKEAIRSANLPNRVETSLLVRSVPRFLRRWSRLIPKVAFKPPLLSVNDVLEATDKTTGSVVELLPRSRSWRESLDSVQKTVAPEVPPFAAPIPM